MLLMVCGRTCLPALHCIDCRRLSWLVLVRKEDMWLLVLVVTATSAGIFERTPLRKKIEMPHLSALPEDLEGDCKTTVSHLKTLGGRFENTRDI